MDANYRLKRLADVLSHNSVLPFTVVNCEILYENGPSKDYL